MPLTSLPSLPILQPRPTDELPDELPPGTRVHADLTAFAAFVVERDALADLQVAV